MRTLHLADKSFLQIELLSVVYQSASFKDGKCPMEFMEFGYAFIYTG